MSWPAMCFPIRESGNESTIMPMRTAKSNRRSSSSFALASDTFQSPISNPQFSMLSNLAHDFFQYVAQADTAGDGFVGHANAMQHDVFGQGKQVFGDDVVAVVQK